MTLTEGLIRDLIHKHSLAWMNDKGEGGFAHYCGRLVADLLGKAGIAVEKDEVKEGKEEGGFDQLKTLETTLNVVESGLLRMASRHTVMKRMTYRCANQTCGKRMRLFFFPDEQIALWINCDYCKGGRNVRPEEQEKLQVGMRAELDSLTIFEHFEDGREEVRREDARLAGADGSPVEAAGPKPPKIRQIPPTRH